MLTDAQLAGVWKDEQGGSLVLARDATFSASSACGDYFESTGFDVASVKTGAGTWESDTDPAFDDEPPTSTVRIDFGPDDVGTQYEASGTTATPMLWTYIGDPDGGKRCILHKETAR